MTRFGGSFSSERHFGVQVGEITSASFLNQLVGAFRLKLTEFFDDLSYSIWVVCVLVSHAKVIPGISVHRL